MSARRDANGAVHRRGAVMSAGFTLVEVLIALTLLSVLMLVLTGAMRAMGQTEERVEQRVAEAGDYRAAVQLLGDVLGQVSARTYPSPRAGAPPQVPFFVAAPDSLAWIGVLPARYGIGGRQYLRLAVEVGPAGGQLVLRHSPWTGSPVFDAWDQAEPLVLAAPVEALALRYQMPATGVWSPAWPPPDVPIAELPRSLLPGVVTLQLTGAMPDWPPLAVEVRATRESDPSARSQAAFGGSAP